MAVVIATIAVIATSAVPSTATTTPVTNYCDYFLLNF